VTIALYVFPPSPRAFKVMAVAEHLGLDVEYRNLDMLNGAHKTPEFQALNPNMKMPVLKHGDYVLWESNAILQYMASLRPEAGLLPQDERGRLDATRWQFWDLAHWDPACACFVFENVVKPVVMKIGEPDPAALEKGAEVFHRFAGVLDGQLRGRKFVLGDVLTVADFSLGASMNMAEMARYPVQDYAEIRRWHAALMALPAWQKTLARTAMPPIGSGAAA
jgi:glutathione S-transferase